MTFDELFDIEKADTFDILLFKTNGMGPSVVRWVSDNEFDHAALVLRYKNDPSEMYFLEASSAGVQILRYSRLKQRIGNFYQKVVLRHLDFKRSDE